jgi:hypothetical protein
MSTHTPTDAAQAMIDILESAADDLAHGDEHRALAAVEGVIADLKTCLHVEVVVHDPIVKMDIYGHEVDCRILAKHGMGTIDVERVSDGKCFRISGLSMAE